MTLFWTEQVTGGKKDSREGEIEHLRPNYPVIWLHLWPRGGSKDRSSDSGLAMLMLQDQH